MKRLLMLPVLLVLLPTLSVAEGLGNYPVQETMSAEDRLLIVAPDATKAEGWALRQVPGSAVGGGTVEADPNAPAQALKATTAAALADGAIVPESAIPATMATDQELSTGLGLKQDAATAFSGSWDALTDIPAEFADGTDDGEVSTITVGTDPSKAAHAEEADALAVDFVLDDSNLPDTIARDAELPDMSLKLNTPTGTPDGTTFARGDGTWAVPTGSTILTGVDTTIAKVAESIEPQKTTGEPGTLLLYETTTTGTDGAGFVGPASAVAKTLYRLPNTANAGKTWINGTPEIVTINDIEYIVVPKVESDLDGGDGTILEGVDVNKAAQAELADALITSFLLDDANIPDTIARDSELGAAGTIEADGTDDTKAAKAVLADTLVTDFVLDTGNLPAAMATDQELTDGLVLKQDAATGTPDGTKVLLDNNSWGSVPSGTIAADGTDPAKAAEAVLADTLVTDFVLSETNMPAAMATDAEVTTAISGVSGSTITPDTTDNTKAAIAVVAESMEPVKVDGDPGTWMLYEATTTETDGAGFVGPSAATAKTLYRFPNSATDGKTWVNGTPATETIGGVTYTVVPLVESTPGGAATVDNTSYAADWENDLDGTSKDSLYDKLEAIATTIATLTQTMIDGGIKIFTVVFGTPAEDSWHSTVPDITATVSVAGSNTISGATWELNDSGSPVSTGLTADDAAFDAASEAVTLTGLTLAQGPNKISLRGVSDPDTQATATDLNINFDNVLPVIVAEADGTHDGTASVLGELTLTEINPDGVTFSATNALPASGSCVNDGDGTYSIALTPEPAGTDQTIAITYAATDLAGNVATGTDLLQAFDYTAGGIVDDFSTDTSADYTSFTDKTLTISSGTAETAGYVIAAFYHATDLGSTDHYVEGTVKIGALSTMAGFVFRSNGTPGTTTGNSVYFATDRAVYSQMNADTREGAIEVVYGQTLAEDAFHKVRAEIVGTNLTIKIDLNQDLDFLDAGEVLAVQTSYAADYTGNFAGLFFYNSASAISTISDFKAGAL